MTTKANRLARGPCSSWLLMLIISVMASSLLHLPPVGARITAADAAIHGGSKTDQNRFAQLLHALFSTSESKEMTSTEEEEEQQVSNEIPLLPQVLPFGASEMSLHLSEKRQSRTAQHYCGRQMVSMLASLCQFKGYLSPFQISGKRSVSALTSQINAEGPSNDVAVAAETPKWPFINSQKAHQVLVGADESSFKRQTRGIHDECCVKPCTWKELSSYCQPGK